MSPLYLYHCSHCDYEVEKLEPISAQTTQVCPECKKQDALKRKISSSSFILTGKCWNRDGYF